MGAPNYLGSSAFQKRFELSVQLWRTSACCKLFLKFRFSQCDQIDFVARLLKCAASNCSCSFEIQKCAPNCFCSFGFKRVLQSVLVNSIFKICTNCSCSLHFCNVLRTVLLVSNFKLCSQLFIWFGRTEYYVRPCTLRITTFRRHSTMCWFLLIS